MDKKVMNVYSTENYRRFKKLLDNREVTPQRVSQIVKSIKTVGYIKSPIIVNEKYEVIDGQGRLAAAESMGLPVYFVVEDGIGIDECRAMNLHQSNWTVKDFIHSYAEGGNISYINLRNLLKEYEKILGASTLYGVACHSRGDSGGNAAETLKKGRLDFKQRAYEQGRDVCAYLADLSGIINRIDGRKDLYYAAIRFAINVDGCNKADLKARLVRRQACLIPVATMVQALEVIESCYNYHCGKKIYFATEYRKYCDLARKKAV